MVARLGLCLGLRSVCATMLHVAIACRQAVLLAVTVWLVARYANVSFPLTSLLMRKLNFLRAFLIIIK